MEFTVPQFTEYEAKIFGPFTFKQFVVVAAAGIVCFISFYKAPLYISVPVIILVGGGSFGLTFLKIQGRSPLIILKNLLFFSISPKIYIWKRKIIAPKMIQKIEKEEIKEEEKRITRKSKLNQLSTKISTRTK